MNKCYGMHYVVAQPASLESWALKELVTWIASHMEKLAAQVTELERTHPNRVQDFISRCIEIIRNHIEIKLPGTFHDKAMVELNKMLPHVPMTSNLCSREILLTVRSHMIQTLFTKNLTSLSITHDHERYYSKMHLVTGLTDLTINYCILTDDILECVVNNCKLIENLKLHNSKGLTDASMNILVRLSKLKSIDLSFTGVSETGIQNLLTICPDIECIETEFDVAQALVNIAKTEGNERRFNLKSYPYCSDITLELQEALVKMCPSIEKLDLDYSCDYIKVFYELKNLKELELRGFEFYADQVKELLQAIGRNLVSLYLYVISEMDYSAMDCVYLSCPNLQHLNIEECIFQETKISPYGQGTEISPLKYLKRISVERSEGWCCDWVPNQLYFHILSNCLNVEHLDLTGADENLLINILERYPEKLKYLKHMTLYFDEFDGALSDKAKAAIDRVVQNSMCPLEVVIM